MLTKFIAWLNQLLSVIAGVVLAPIAWLPGWLSAMIIGAVSGILMLVVFKYVSNQNEIKRTRSQIKANLLALSLFKDDLGVTLRVQRALWCGVSRVLVLSLVPMLVMSVPITLLLGQMALWFGARPLSQGAEAVVTVHMAENTDELLGKIQLVPTPVATVTIGPVRVPSKNIVCWNIRAAEPGLHNLVFNLSDKQFTKELAVGQNYMMVSLVRPSSHLIDVLWNPRERPFDVDSPVQSIDVTYLSRSSWITGTYWWVVNWFVASIAAAFAAKPFLNVSF